MKKWKILVYAVTLLLVVFFLYFYKFDLNIFSAILNYYYLILAFLAYITSIFIASYRTKFFLNSLSKSHFNFSSLIKAEFINKSAYYIIPGRFNIPVKAIALNKFFSLGKIRSLSITSFEFFFDTAVTLLIASTGLFIFTQGLPFFDLHKFILFFFFTLIVLLVFFAFPFKWIPLVEKKFLKIKFNKIAFFFEIFFRFIKESRKIWKSLIFNKNFIPILFFTALYWIISILVYYFLFFSAGVSASLSYLTVILSFGIFISGISQIPGGLGIRDGVMVFLFSSLGYPESASLMVVIVQRIFSIVPTLIGYFFLTKLGINFLSNKVK